MKVKILRDEKASLLENEINREIEKLECAGQEIIDIKFVIREDYMYNFYAMIIYKDINLTQ